MPYRRYVVLIGLLSILPVCAEPQNMSFSQAKRIATKIYKDHKQTFYCHCEYNAKKKVNHRSCSYKIRKNKKRANRIEWEHVMPAWAFGHTRQCWREPEAFAACEKKKGKYHSGRKCCRKVDTVFKAMEGDLHNLVPAVGELNSDRSNFSFGIVAGEPRKYGSCDFEVDFKHRVVEPMPEVQGDIARVYFYMSKKYGLRMSKKQQKLFQVWDKQDPQDSWEREKLIRIELSKKH